MKRFIFIDVNKDRHTKISEKLSSNLVRFYEKATALLNEIGIIDSEDIVSIHFNNPEIIKTMDGKKCSRDELTAISELAETFHEKKVPIFLHTDGSNTKTDSNGIEGFKNIHALFKYSWLCDHIRDLMDGWKDCGDDINKYIDVIDSILYEKSITQAFTPLDILIQGCLTINGASEGKPWAWMNNKGKPLMPGSMIGSEMAKQRRSEIEKDPLKWFEPAIENLKEIFPPDDPKSNTKLKTALANMPIVQKQLLINSKLAEFSKLIMSAHRQRDNYTQVDFLKSVHEAYLGISGKVLDEFLGFRSYVSHTLCKNRFYLYVSSRNMKAFIEPNVWPILKSEIESLFELGPTLYGIECQDVFEEDKKAVHRAIQGIDILKNGKEWSSEIDKHADIIKGVLEDIPEKLGKSEDFRIDLSKVKSYQTENSEALKKRIIESINKIINPLIGEPNLDNNEQYWKSYPEIMKLIRIFMVQIILEGRDEEFISEMKNIMQAVMYPENNRDKLRKYEDSAAS